MFFNKPTTEQPTAPTLPPGFDDPGSPFFIPVEFREIWIRREVNEIYPFGAESDFTATATNLLARSESEQKTTEARGPRPRDFAGVNAWEDARWGFELDLRRKISSTRAVEVHQIANHMFRLEYIRPLLAQEQERARIERGAMIRDTCPICGDHDASRIGAVTDRGLLPGHPIPRGVMHPLQPQLRSCAACHAVAAAEALRLLAEAPTAAGSTRAILLAPLVLAELDRAAQDPS